MDVRWITYAKVRWIESRYPIVNHMEHIQQNRLSDFMPGSLFCLSTYALFYGTSTACALSPTRTRYAPVVMSGKTVSPALPATVASNAPETL